MQLCVEVKPTSGDRNKPTLCELASTRRVAVKCRKEGNYGFVDCGLASKRPQFAPRW